MCAQKDGINPVSAHIFAYREQSLIKKFDKFTDLWYSNSIAVAKCGGNDNIYKKRNGVEFYV